MVMPASGGEELQQASSGHFRPVPESGNPPPPSDRQHETGTDSTIVQLTHTLLSFVVLRRGRGIRGLTRLRQVGYMVGDSPGRGRDGVIGHGQASKGNTADGAMYDSNRDGEFMIAGHARR